MILIAIVRLEVLMAGHANNDSKSNNNSNSNINSNDATVLVKFAPTAKMSNAIKRKA